MDPMWLIAVPLLLFASSQEPPPQNYVPADTKVALLPIANTSGEKWKELRERQEKAAREHLQDELGLRGFVLLPADPIAEKLAQLHVDLTDEENHNRSTLFTLGPELGANLLVFAVLTNTRQDGSSPFGAGYGVTEFKLWLLDVDRKQPIISAKSSSARSARATYKASDRQVWAVPLALDDILKDFLAPYKKAKK